MLGYDLFTSYSPAIYETPTTYWIFAGGLREVAGGLREVAGGLREVAGGFAGGLKSDDRWLRLYRSIRAKSGGVVKVVNHRKPIKYSQRVHLSHATSRAVLVWLMGSWKSFFFLRQFDRLCIRVHSWIVGQLGSGPVGHWSVD